MEDYIFERAADICNANDFVSEIEDQILITEQCIRNIASRTLMDTSEDEKMSVSILGGNDAQGISDNQKVEFVRAWQYPCQGYICFEDENGVVYGLEDFDIREQWYIVKQLIEVL